MDRSASVRVREHAARPMGSLASMYPVSWEQSQSVSQYGSICSTHGGGGGGLCVVFGHLPFHP